MTGLGRESERPHCISGAEKGSSMKLLESNLRLMDAGGYTQAG